jgi:N-acetylglucosaminyldiphosphoundecaprenol N-acetyl-beta-D-mannosaminyltransferase
VNSTIEILGVKVHCVNFEQTLDLIAQWIDEKESLANKSKVHQVCTVNPEFIMTARRDLGFADVLRKADLCVPDGIGVLWAARRQGVTLHERVTGSDGIYRICRRAAMCGWRVYFLGAAEGVAEEAARRLIHLYPGLHVAGAYSGTPHAHDWPEISRRLQAAQADVLFVAYGHPRQDFWIAQHRHELPVQVAMGVGGAFDFVAGITPRAPCWMQKWGIEWLYRLVQQPWRWRRMTVLPLFTLQVLLGRITYKFYAKI